MQMDTVQLRKLVQYLITDMPEQSLFAAQTLVDELLQPDSTLNLESGAPGWQESVCILVYTVKNGSLL